MRISPNGSFNTGGMWVTDGTTAGTQSFLPIGFRDYYNSLYLPNAIQTDADHFLFAGDSMGLNDFVFISDGTPGGTQMIKDFNPAQVIASGSQAHPGNFTPVGNGKFIFTASTVTDGREIWVTDGTAAGTTMIKNIGPGAKDYLTFQDGSTLFHSDGSKAYFFANDSIHGAEPWVSDGTAAGTMMLKDINPGIAKSLTSSQFATLNGKTYLIANSPAEGTEIFETDGTTAGTHLLTDFFPGTPGGVSADLLALNGKLLFNGTQTPGSRHLYAYDPTANSYTLLGTNPVSGTITKDNVFCNKIYFNATDSAFKYRLSVSDGTPASTGYIRNAPAEEGTPFNFYYNFSGPALVQLQDSLYFLGRTDATGFELFKIPVCTEPNSFPALGISEIEKLASLQNVAAYPNPSTNSFSLHLLADLQVVDVRILDLSGRSVFAQQNVVGEQSISHNLAAGMYLLEVSSGAGQVMQKLMVR